MWVASRGFLGARFSHSAMGALGASESEDMRLALSELVPVKGKPKGEPPLLGSPKNRHTIFMKMIQDRQSKCTFGGTIQHLTVDLN